MEQEQPQSDQRALVDEVLRKVGRNMLLFQEIERLLKFIVTASRAEGTAASLEQRQAARAARIQGQTLGTLVGQWVEEVLVDPGRVVEDEAGARRRDDPVAPWMSTSVRFEVAPEAREAERARLKSMVDERNDLAHNFLRRLRAEPGHLEDAAAYLDQQRERVMPIREWFQSCVKCIQDMLAEHFNPVAINRIADLIWLQSSPVVAVLCDVASETQRPDGWAFLAQAGNRAEKQVPDAFANVRTRYGYKSLRAFAVATELFEFRDEPMPGGGSMTLYRVRREDGETGGTPIPPS